MNSPTNEPAVKLNGTPDGIAGLSDVFILLNFASIKSSEGLHSHRELLEKINIRDFANKLADLPKCSSYRLMFSRCWVEILVTVSIVALLVFMYLRKLSP